jgi:CPA2 family monovalent cation:H+ antiporter-2
MDFWQLLMEMLLLLGVAFILGALAQRLKQSAIIGYLLAGTLLGPMLFNTRAVMDVAELGVALLLFSIGLEFSFGRLKRLGRVALVGGGLQVVGTLGIFALGALIFVPLPQALSLGAITALSSTAVVLRVLVDRAEVDAVHGRTALGVLLLQDIAVVPLVLMLTVMASGGTAGEVVLSILRTLAAAGGLVIVFYLLFYQLVPRVLTSEGMYANRELVVLLAILAAVGSTWASHAVGLSPALGAFLAGMLLGESPFATQIRSDVGSLRTLFVTLFFTSIGLLMDPVWLLRYGGLALAAMVGIMVVKTAVIYLIGRLLQMAPRYALAAGLTLSQIGEFSFVLATTALQGGLITEGLFALVVTANIFSLFAAPYMVAYALQLADGILGRLQRRSEAPSAEAPLAEKPLPPAVFVVGYGPAGREVSFALRENGLAAEILELNPAAIERGKADGVPVHIGDATSTEVLAHAGIGKAKAVVVTVPDPGTARDITAAVRSLAPGVCLLVRSRFQRGCPEITTAGATKVVDEETTVGRLLAQEVLLSLELGQEAALACALSGRVMTGPAKREREVA